MLKTKRQKIRDKQKEAAARQYHEVRDVSPDLVKFMRANSNDKEANDRMLKIAVEKHRDFGEIIADRETEFWDELSKLLGYQEIRHLHEDGLQLRLFHKFGRFQVGTEPLKIKED